MTTMILQVPDALEKEHDETVRLIAAKLYESGKLSLGQAAEMCSMKKWDFAEILINYGVHYLDVSAAADLDDFKDIAVVKDSNVLAEKLGVEMLRGF